MNNPARSRATLLLILCCASFPACAETYYDCIKPDGTISYRVTPCAKGETTEKQFDTDLAIYEEADRKASGYYYGGSINLRAAPNGNFYVAGAINGHHVTYIVDTGASMLTLSAQAARLYGIGQCRQQTVSQTANGKVNGCIATAANVSVGGFRFRNVEAVVIPDSPILLGMNVLSQLKVEHSNGSMQISNQ